MSWVVEAWKEGLPAKALQKIQELESQLEKLKKDRQQRQLQLESLDAAFQKEKQKADKEKNEASALKRENQSLMEACANLEKAKEKIAHDHQLKETQVNILDGQVHAGKKQIERLEQDLKRYKSDLEKSQQVLMAMDLPPGGTPQKSVIAPFTPTKVHSDGKFEELQEQLNREVEERKKLEAELKSLQIKKVNPPVSQNTMSHREIARNQTSSSVFSWEQDHTPSRQGTPLKRGYNPSHFPWEQEGTPSKQMFRTERADSFTENTQNESIKIHNQELKSKICDLELRLQVQDKDLKNNLNKMHETQLQLEKVQTELAEKEKALNKSRDELMRATAQFDQAAVKCTALEQKVKKLSEELACQMQNAESSRCSMEQKMKEKDKEHQAELLQQQHSLQILEQECAQVKSKLNQELQQAKNDYNSHQVELDKATAARKNLEKDAEEFKQKLCKAEQALHTSQSKEAELVKRIEEITKEGNLMRCQLDQKSREALQWEEELQTTKQSLKQSQTLTEDLTKTNIVEEGQLKAAQEMLQKPESSFSLEKLKETIDNLEKERNSVQDLLKRKDIENEEMKTKLVQREENTEALQKRIGDKEKECEELKKEVLCLSERKLEMQRSTNQLSFERDELLRKSKVLESSLGTQQELIKSLETQKEAFCLQIQNINKMVENKCAELDLQKQAYVDLQQKAEFADEKHRKEEENLCLKLSQLVKQVEEMESSNLKDQLCSLELTLQGEKRLNSDLQQQVEELLKIKIEVEKRLCEAEQLNNNMSDTNIHLIKLQEDAVVHHLSMESLVSSLEDKEKQLSNLLKELAIQETFIQGLQNNNKILAETMEQMNILFELGNLQKQNLSKIICLGNEEAKKYEGGPREDDGNILEEKMNVVEENLYFANYIREKANTVVELIEMYRSERLLLLERCEKAEHANELSMEEDTIQFKGLLEEKAGDSMSTKFDLLQHDELQHQNLLTDQCEEYTNKCISLEKENISLKEDLGNLQALMHQKHAEIIHLQNMSSAEIDSLRCELNNCKAEHGKMQEEHQNVFNHNQQLIKMLNLQSDPTKASTVGFQNSNDTNDLKNSVPQKDCEFNQIQVKLEHLKMDLDFKVESSSCDEQVTKVEESLLTETITLVESEPVKPLPNVESEEVVRKLCGDILHPKTETFDHSFFEEASVECPFNSTSNTTMDSFMEFQQLKAIVLERQSQANVLKNSVVDSAADQGVAKPVQADVSTDMNAIESFCQINETPPKEMEDKIQMCTPTKTEELHDLKQAIQSSRIELDSLRRQHFCEKEEWQQTLTDMTREMERKLAAEKQHTEHLSLQLETARLELQCLDLSARSILCTDNEATLHLNLKPEYHGKLQSNKLDMDSTQEGDFGPEDLNSVVGKSPITSSLENLAKPDIGGTLEETNIQSTDRITRIMTMDPLSAISTDNVLEYQEMIGKLQFYLQQSNSENVLLQKDIEDKNSRVDALLIEIKDLSLRIESQPKEQSAETSEVEIDVLELEHVNNDIVQTIASMESDNQQPSRSAIELGNNLDKMTSPLEMYKAQLSEAKQMLINSELARSEWNEKYLQAENELKRAKSERANIENHALAMEADIEELHVSNKQLTNDIDKKLKIISTIEDQLNAVTSERNQLNQELCSLSEGHEELEQMHQKLKEKVKELQSWKVDSTEFIRILEAEVKSQKALVQTAKSDVNQLSVENTNAVHDAQQFENNMALQTAHTEELQNQIRELEEGKEMVLNNYDALKNKFSELESENIRLTMSLEGQVMEKNDIVSKLNLAEEKVAQMQNAMESLKILVESLEQEKQCLSEKMKNSDQTSESLQDKVEHLQRELEMSEGNLENIIIQLEDSKEEADNLKASHRDMIETLKDIDMEFNALRAKNETLISELQQAREKIHESNTSVINFTDILEKNELEKAKLIEESESLVCSLHAQITCLRNELLEKDSVRQELEQLLERHTLQPQQLQIQVDQLTVEKEDLAKACKDFQWKLSEWEVENSRLNKKLKCLLTENTEIVSRLNSTQEEVEQMRSGIEKLKLQIESDEKKKCRLIEKLKLSEMKTNSLEAKIASIENDLKISENPIHLKPDQTEIFTLSEINSFKVENEELKNELQQTKQRVSEFEESQLKVAEMFVTCEQENNTLLAEPKDFVSSLQTHLRDLQAEVREQNALVHLNQELEKRVETLLVEKEELQVQVVQLNEDRGRVLSQSESLQAKLIESETEISRLANALESLLCEKGEIDLRLTCSQEEITRLESAIEYLKVRIDFNEQEKQGLLEDMKCSERKADSLQDKIENLERNLQMAEEHLEDMIIQLETSKEEAENEKAVNEDMIKNQKDLILELDTIREKHESIQRELHQSHEIISQLEASQSNSATMIEQYEKEKVKIMEESQSTVFSLQAQMEVLTKQLAEGASLVALTRESTGSSEIQAFEMDDLRNQAKHPSEEDKLLLQMSETFQIKLIESESEVSRLNNVVECLIKEKGNIEVKLNSCTEEIARMQRDIKVLKSQIASNEEENQARLEDVKQLEQKEESLQGNIESLEGNLLVYKGNLEKMTVDAQTSKEEVANLKAINKHLTFEFDALRAKYEVVMEELQESRAQVSQVEASQKNLSVLQEQYEQEKVRMMEDSNSQILNLETRLKEFNVLKEERDKLVRQRQEYEKNSEGQQLKMEDLLNKAQQGTEEREIHLQTLDALKIQLVASESEIIRLTTALEYAHIENQKLQSRLYSATEEVSQLKCNIDNMTLQIRSCEKEQQEMVEKLEHSEQKADLLQEKCESLEKNMLASKENLEDMMAEVETSRGQAAVLKTQNEEIMKNQGDLAFKLDAERATNEGLNNELQHAREQLEASQSKLSDILHKYDQEKGEIDELKSLLIALNKQLEERDSVFQEYKINAEQQILDNEELQNKIRHVNQEKEFLSQTSEMLKTKLNESESEISRLSKILENMLYEKAELETKFASTQKEVFQLQSVNSDLKTLQESAEKENKQIRLKLEEGEQRESSILEKVEILERDLQFSTENRENMSVQIESYKEEVEKLSALKEDMNQKVSHLDLEIDGLRATNDHVTQELEQSRAKVCELESGLTIMSDSLEQSQQEKIQIEDASKSSVKSLQAQLKTLNEEFELLFKEQETLKSKVQDLTSQLVCLEQGKMQLLHELTEAQSNYTLTQSSKDSLTEQVVQYKQELKEKTQEIDILLQKITDAEQWKENLLSKIEIEREDWKKEKEGLQKLTDELEQKMNLMSVQEQSFKHTIDTQQVNLTNLEKELSASTSEKSTLADKVAELNEDCISLNNQLNTTNQKLECIQDEFTVERNALLEKLQNVIENGESTKIQLDLTTSEKEALKKSFDDLHTEQTLHIEKLKQEVLEYQSKIQKANDNQEVALVNVQKEHQVEIKTYQEKLASAEQSINTQNLEIHILKSSKDELNESLKQAHKKLEEHNQTKDEKLKPSLAQLQKENKSCRSKLELFTKSYKQLEQEKVKLQKHIIKQEALLAELKEKSKKYDEMDNTLKELKTELEELKEYAEEKTKEADESVEKYCGLLVNQHKLEEANETLKNRVDFLTGQLKPALTKDRANSSPNLMDACDQVAAKEKSSKNAPSKMAGKRARTVESKEDGKEAKSNTPKTVTKRVKSSISSEVFHHKTGGEDPEYELEGLPSVVQKGFADIPKGKLSPYVMRRTTQRTSPRLAAQSESPANAALNKGILETLPDLFKPTASTTKSPKVVDVHNSTTASVSGSAAYPWSPLAAHNKAERKTPLSPKDLEPHEQQRRQSQRSKPLPEKSPDGENCKVQ